MSNLPTDKPSLTCPRCGRSLNENSIDGLCAACLGALNFVTDTALPNPQPGESDQSKLPPLTPEELAAHFPQLEIIEFLGRGGMGVVYKAQQKTLGRTVALKLLAPERADDPQFAKRFIQEARALAALSHPNIVTIHDFGQAGGYYYLLMEYVDGVNLRQAMAAGRLEPEQALAIVPPVCEALQYAHEHQIVHRDIKPENLLLDKAGRIKIVDFGIAKMLGTDSVADFAESQPAGTPQYMAPEQKLHLQTDHRADIYSLGVVLYEMLTGELPTASLQTPSKLVHVDVRIDEIVLRALEAKPELRFSTADEFRAQVQTVTLASANDRSTNVAHQSSVVDEPLPRESTTTKFSRYAVLGACWVAVAPVAIATAGWTISLGVHNGNGKTTFHGPTPLQWLVLVPMFVFAVMGPIVATILGWKAIRQIRASNEPIQGLSLAVFEALVFPLAALNALVALAIVALAKMFVDFFSNPNEFGNANVAVVTRLANWVHFNKEVVVLFAVAVCVALSISIMQSVYRSARMHLVATQILRKPAVESNESTVATIAILLALMSLLLGGLGVFQPLENSWPLMALSLFMSSMAIFIAVPVRRTSAGKSAIVIAGLAVATWPVLALIVAENRSQTATVARPPTPPKRGFPIGAHIGRDHFSVLVTHDQVDPVLHYVLFYEGNFSTSSSGMQNHATNTWTDEGAIRLHNGRSFGYSRHALSPEELVINGTTWSLHLGRVFKLGPDGSVQQFPFNPSLEVASDPAQLAKQIALNLNEGQGGSSSAIVPEHIDFKVQSVEAIPGSRKITIHFDRDPVHGLGLEFSQDVIASADEKMPSPGYRDFQQKMFLGSKDSRQFTWELPREFNDEQAAAAARKVMEQAQKYSHLNKGALIEFAKLKHVDGWTYILLARVLPEPVQSSQHPPVPSPFQVRNQEDWAPATLELSKRIGLSRADGSALPTELIEWGAAQGALQAGVIMSNVTPEGEPMEARLVLRNATGGNLAPKLQLNGRQMQLVTYNSVHKNGIIRVTSQLLPVHPEVLVALEPGQQIEFESIKLQLGGTRVPDVRECLFVNTAPGFMVTKFALLQPDGPALETGEITVLVNEKYGTRSTVTHALSFSLHHQLARNMEVAVRQVIKGRPIQDAKASPNDRTLFVLAYNDVMQRVKTFITVNDATDTIARDDEFNYPRFSPLIAARSFFHACAIEDDDRAIANLLSVGVLAELRGDQSAQHTEFKNSGSADPHWEAELRSDWPGKREKIRELVSQWNRFALINLQEPQTAGVLLQPQPTIEASFADAPVNESQVRLIRCNPNVSDQAESYCIDSLPPWRQSDFGHGNALDVPVGSPTNQQLPEEVVSVRAELSQAKLRLAALKSQLPREDLSHEEFAVWEKKMDGEIEHAQEKITTLEKRLNEIEVPRAHQ